MTLLQRELQERYVIINDTPTKVSSVYIWNWDSTARMIRPVWKPWEDTLLYMPLNWDTLDYSWNNNNGTWTWTTDYRNIWTWNKKYAYINTNSAIVLTSFPVWTWNPNDFTFACWTKTNSNKWYSCPFHIGSDSRWNRFTLILNYPYSSSNYRHIIDLYWIDEDVSPSYSSPTNVWERVFVVYTYKNSWHNHTIYINNVQAWSTNTYSLNIWSSYKYIGRSQSDSIYAEFWLSEIIFESWIWTEEQRTDYYNMTKWIYWVS